jgi:LysM domain
MGKHWYLAKLSVVVSAALAWCAGSALAQVTTPAQKATAQQVASTGVPLSELSPTAPDNYTVKSGDTLWAISSMFLKNAWRWPELWGMNMVEIRNPHRIFSGQQLFLDKSNGRATLRSRQNAEAAPTEVVKVSPRTRFESLADAAIPTLKSNLIEPFLAEPMIVDEKTFAQAPRIVATQEGRVLLSKGDRAYARSQIAGDLSMAKGVPTQYRVFRNATPLKDPGTGEILAYEAQYVGAAELVRPESIRETIDKDGKTWWDTVSQKASDIAALKFTSTASESGSKTLTQIIPATIDIVRSKEEMRTGDRLIPEPAREFTSYQPRAPEQRIVGARIVSVYGSAVANASQNTVVVVSKGAAHGLERGHVLAILKDGEAVVDRTDPNKPTIKLPDERNGLLMVFRVFESVSYALVLNITDGVKVGDHLVNPR